MKLMIASDIHGAAGFCRALLAACAAEAPDRLLLLGDILYHGPRNDLPEGYDPKQVIALLNPLRDRLLCVRGNCDTEVDQMVLDFPILSDSCAVWAGARAIFATHGHRWNEEWPPPMQPGTILLNGHTHVPALREHGSYTYINPGSVSIPKGGSWHGYMTLEGGLFRWKDLEGQVRLEHRAP